jgi:hypothetical protein
LDQFVQPLEEKAAEHVTLVRIDPSLPIEREIRVDLVRPTRRVFGILVIGPDALARINPQFREHALDRASRP